MSTQPPHLSSEVLDNLFSTAVICQFIATGMQRKEIQLIHHLQTVIELMPRTPSSGKYMPDGYASRCDCRVLTT